MQDDVLAIVDASNNVVGSYTYDAWGKVLSVTGTIAEINPIRYRGYYYDTETGLYYLNSRYYDPEIGRFVNADSIDTLTEVMDEVTDKNLFAYCDNNPLIRVDETGHIWKYALAGGVMGGSWGMIGSSVLAIIGSITPVGWIAISATILLVGAVSIYYYSEHKTTKNGKKRNKHEKGNARRQRDQGGEKRNKSQIGRRIGNKMLLIAAQ